MRSGRKSRFIGWLSVALVMFGGIGKAHAALVRVTTALDGASTVALGERTKVLVQAAVEQPQSATDGVFSFDVDVVVANFLTGVASPFAIVGSGTDRRE
jgi:hypothetical protein